MKAVAWTRYGTPADALQIVDASKPIPGPDEVLIKVHSSTVTAGDARLRGFRIPVGFWLPTRLVFGLFRPRKKVPGMDFSGEVEALGKEVKSFSIGDTVFGTAGMNLGAHAESLCLPEKAVFIEKPEEIAHDDAAAAIFGGQTAIHFLKDKARLGPGHKILVNGASGAVGTASIQLAKYLGADVTAVCSTGNIELVKSLGADKTIDYTRENVEASEDTYDFVLDTVGNMPLSRCSGLLKEKGQLISIASGLFANLSAIWNKKLISGVAGESKAHLELLKNLIVGGDLKPVIDRIYPLEKIVEAHEYVDRGHKKGNVVVSVAG